MRTKIGKLSKLLIIGVDLFGRHPGVGVYLSGRGLAGEGSCCPALRAGLSSRPVVWVAVCRDVGLWAGRAVGAGVQYMDIQYTKHATIHPTQALVVVYTLSAFTKPLLCGRFSFRKVTKFSF